MCLLHAFWLQWCGNNTNTFEAFVAARMGFVPHVDEQPLPRVPSSYAPRVDVDDVRRKLREGEALEKERQRELLEVVAIEAALLDLRPMPTSSLAAIMRVPSFMRGTKSNPGSRSTNVR